MRKHKLKSKVSRILLLGSLASTRAISRTEFNVPSKWHSVLDNFRCISLMAYGKLSEIDSDVQKEVLEKEDMLDRRLGNKKFYDKNELDKLREMQEDIDI
jgi:hypothetical protein